MSSRPFLAVLVVAILPGLSHAAEPTATRQFPVANFTGVNVTGADDVVVREGPFAVSATGRQEVLDRLQVRVANNMLVVSRKGRVSGRDSSARITVTMPAIASLQLTGAGDVAVQRAAGPRFSARLTGAGNLRIQAVAAQDVRFELTGAGNLYAAGRSERLSVALSGAGDMDLKALASRDISVVLNGVGDVDARASGIATIKANGVGSVSVTGTADCRVTKSMLASVTCG